MLSYPAVSSTASLIISKILKYDYIFLVFPRWRCPKITGRKLHIEVQHRLFYIPHHQRTVFQPLRYIDHEAAVNDVLFVIHPYLGFSAEVFRVLRIISDKADYLRIGMDMGFHPAGVFTGVHPGEIDHHGAFDNMIA